MAGERKPHFEKVGLILAVSAFGLFMAAGFVWARRPMDEVLNEAVVMLLAITAAIELGLAMFFFWKALR